MHLAYFDCPTSHSYSAQGLTELPSHRLHTGASSDGSSTYGLWSNCSISDRRRRITSSSSMSITERRFPNFIRPSINPSKECDLWGPTCQTGTIVVDVNLTTTVSPTTIPCSSYLTAQSLSAQSPDAYKPYQYSDYMASFGRSPQCQSFADYASARINYKRRHQGLLLDEPGPYMSRCPSNVTALWSDYTPPRVTNSHIGSSSSDYNCCGECTLSVKGLRLLIFPPATPTHCSRNLLETGVASGTISHSPNSGNLTAAFPFINYSNVPWGGFVPSAISTIVVNGYTLYVSCPYPQMLRLRFHNS